MTPSSSNTPAPSAAYSGRRSSRPSRRPHWSTLRTFKSDEQRLSAAGAEIVRAAGRASARVDGVTARGDVLVWPAMALTGTALGRTRAARASLKRGEAIQPASLFHHRWRGGGNVGAGG